MNDYVIDLSTINRLVEIIENDEFYTMPRGLTREERRAWCKKISEGKKVYNLVAESILDWDDSEFQYRVLGSFEKDDKEKLLELVDSFWDNIGEECLNDVIVEGILNAIENNEERFEIIEDDSTVDCESCRRRFTFIVN